MPLTLLDFSDRELLVIVSEVAEENGGQATSAAIAQALGMTEKERNQSVGARMAAMRRFGLIDKDPERFPNEWKLTDIGLAMAFGRARQAQLNAVDNSRPEELLLMVREMAKRQAQTSVAARHMIRREWRRSTWGL